MEENIQDIEEVIKLEAEDDCWLIELGNIPYSVHSSKGHILYRFKVSTALIPEGICISPKESIQINNKEYYITDMYANGQNELLLICEEDS